MFLRSTIKPPILEVLTKTHISEAFRIYFVDTSILLQSKTKPHFVRIRGSFDQTSFFLWGVIVPPSKLIVTHICVPQGFLFYKGGLLMRWVDRTNNRLL